MLLKAFTINQCRIQLSRRGRSRRGADLRHSHGCVRAIAVNSWERRRLAVPNLDRRVRAACGEVNGNNDARVLKRRRGTGVRAIVALVGITLSLPVRAGAGDAGPRWLERCVRARTCRAVAGPFRDDRPTALRRVVLDLRNRRSGSLSCRHRSRACRRLIGFRESFRSSRRRDRARHPAAHHHRESFGFRPTTPGSDRSARRSSAARGPPQT